MGKMTPKEFVVGIVLVITVILWALAGDTHGLANIAICSTAALFAREGARVFACVPYLAYARQDLEFQKGEVISLGVLSRLFRSVGVSSLVTVDIHSSQGLGYFSFPTYSVSAMPLLANYAKNNLKLEREVIK